MNSQPGLFEAGKSGKSRGVAALLCLLLGGFGAHYFYCGQTKAGIYTLLLVFIAGTITCGIVSSIMGIIFLIQGIMMFIKPQEDFEAKYVEVPIDSFGDYFKSIKNSFS